MLVGFRLNLPKPPLICFSDACYQMAEIQTMVNKP